MSLFVEWENVIGPGDLTEASQRIFRIGRFGQFSLGSPSMINFSSLIERIAAAARPDSMCEIGIDRGDNTRFLLWLAERLGAAVSIVDPEISPDLERDLVIGSTATIEIHRALSRDYLREAAPHDVYVIDGDHNYETVTQELDLIAKASAGRSVVMLLHDVGWPFAYRDMYYAPERVSERRPTTRGRMTPFSEEVGDYGVPFDFAVSVEEGGERNGVTAAIEGFLEHSDRDWGYFRVNLYFGMGVLWDRATAGAELQTVLSDLESAAAAFDTLLSHAELNRLMLLTRLHHAADVWRRQKDYIARLEERSAAAAAPAGGGQAAEPTAAPAKPAAVDPVDAVPPPGEPQDVPTRPGAGASPPPRLRELFAIRPPTANYLVNWSKRHRYVYVEVPKTGCTTVKHMLQLAEVNGDRSRLPRNAHDRPYSPLLAPADDPDAFFAAFAGDGYYRFTFVRNPYARVLSAYLDKIVGNEWERHRRLPQLGFAPDSHVTFEAFLERIVADPPDEMDIHWMPQTLILGHDRSRYDFFGRFESFQPHLERVASRLGMGAYFREVRDDRPHATGARSRLAEFYSDRALAIVEDLYREDFETLGYPPGLPG